MISNLRHMKFTLLFYTDGWETGSVIELDHLPSPGSVVWARKGRRDDEGEMYYVDNVMYPERGLDRENAVYLYVRPYRGYNEYGPKTESDRLAERLDKLAGELRAVREEVAELNLRVKSVGETLSGMSDAVEYKQQEIGDRLDDAVFALEAIKESI